MEIHLQSEWQRSYTGYTEATTGKFTLGPTEAVVGDVVRISGRVPPRIFFGDDKFSYLDVTVNSYSASHDWFRGNTTIRHTYTNPHDRHGGWQVSVQGCCRIASVLNNGGSSWALSTVVDLQKWREIPTLSSPLVASISASFNDLISAAQERCTLQGRGLNLLGVCTKFEFVNRDQCPAHVRLLPGAADRAASGASGVARTNPELFVSMVEVAFGRDAQAPAGAPAMGNTQASALQVFVPGTKCDITGIPADECSATEATCCRKVGGNCNPASAQYCSATSATEGLEMLPRAHPDGTIRFPCSLTEGQCAAFGLHTVRIQITDGHVYSIRVARAGQGCAATPKQGVPLLVSCPTNSPCVRDDSDSSVPFSGLYHTRNGGVSSVTIVTEGTQYLNPPLVKLPDSAGCTEEPLLEAIMVHAQSDLLVQMHPRHYCESQAPGLAGLRVPCMPERQGETFVRTVKVLGTPRPQFVPKSFPGEGVSFQPSQRGGLSPSAMLAPTGEATGGAGRGNGLQGGGDLEAPRKREEDARLSETSLPIQATVGHVIAFAGHPVSMTYSAITNWCQSEQGELLADAFGNASCAHVSNGSVSVEFGPLPQHDITFRTLQVPKPSKLREKTEKNPTKEPLS